MKKTFKREVAALLFIALFYLVFTGDVTMAEILVWPVFTFGALSFGLDWWGKGGSVHRPYGGDTYSMYGPRGPAPQRGYERRSERPYRSGGYSDARGQYEEGGDPSGYPPPEK